MGGVRVGEGLRRVLRRASVLSAPMDVAYRVTNRYRYCTGTVCHRGGLYTEYSWVRRARGRPLLSRGRPPLQPLQPLLR